MYPSAIKRGVTHGLKKCDSSFVPGLTWEKHPTWIWYLCIPSWKTNISHLWKTKIIFKGVLGRYFIIYLFFIYHCLSLPSQMSTQPTLPNPLNPCLLAKLLQTWQQTTGFLMEEMLRSPVELGSLYVYHALCTRCELIHPTKNAQDFWTMNSMSRSQN